MPSNMQTPPPKKDRDWGRMSKQLSFWILLILIPLAFIKLMNPTSDQAQTITYTQYDRELERGNIAKVTVQDGKAIVGEFRQPISVKGRDTKKFNVCLPVSNSDEELQRLRAANVEITRAKMGAISPESTAEGATAGRSEAGIRPVNGSATST